MAEMEPHPEDRTTFWCQTYIPLPVGGFLEGNPHLWRDFDRCLAELRGAFMAYVESEMARREEGESSEISFADYLEANEVPPPWGRDTNGPATPSNRDDRRDSDSVRDEPGGS